MLKTRLLATLATTTLFTLAVPAHAGEAPRRAVSYADLALGTTAGRAMLDGRIKRAVQAVCPVANTQSTWEMQAMADCHRTARAGADTQVSALTSSPGRLASR